MQINKKVQEKPPIFRKSKRRKKDQPSKNQKKYIMKRTKINKETTEKYKKKE